MKKLLFTFCLLVEFAASAAYTEFYVQTTGNNLNSGHTPEDTPTFIAVNGYWTNSTGTFFKPGLNPESTVSNGAWASVYFDDTTTNVFVGLVTARSDANDTITVSLTAKSGIPPALNEYATNSIRIGGAWMGPNTNISYTGASDPRMMHPFGFVADTMTNSAGKVPRINIKSGIYCVTNGMTHSLSGPVVFQGYTNTIGDGGMPVIGAVGSGGASFTLLTLSSPTSRCLLKDLIFDGNGTSGNTLHGINTTGSRFYFWNVVTRNMRFNGFNNGGGAVTYVQCEAYSNNIGNAANGAGFNSTSDNTIGSYLYCYSHHNIGSLANGFHTGGSTLVGCISAFNGNTGFYDGGGANSTMINCDSYSNNASGLMLGSNPGCKTVVNCNFFNNGAYGIRNLSSGVNSAQTIIIKNCAFGSGTQTNATGNIDSSFNTFRQSYSVEEDNQTYTINETPWVSPEIGNFTLKSNAVTLADGYASWTQFTTNGLILSYPDIGSAQKSSTNTAVGSSHTFAQ